MMSLFSSFDVSIFFWSLAPMAWLICMTWTSARVVSPLPLLNSYSTKFLDNFLGTLKPLGFTKSLKTFLTSIFLCFFLLNFFSVLPFNFPLSSRFGLVLAVSFSIWLSLMMFLLKNNGKGLMAHMIPEGAPLALIPLLFVIEVISSLIRPITLSVRMVANILAGHILMSLMAGQVLSQVISLNTYANLVGIEFIVALIQSYIFMTMSALYFSEL